MSGNEALVSVCCLGYNHGKFIEKNVRSIWNQSYKNIEIIAVNDGSTDNSAEILDKLAEQSPFPMTVINQSNTGNIGKNLNRAIAKAKGAYLSIIAMDDELYPDALESKLERMVANPNIIFIANSQITGIDNNNNVLNDYVPVMPLDEIENPTAQDILDLEYRNSHSFYVQGSLFRTDIVRKVGCFDEDMIGDDIVLRCKLCNFILQNPQFCFVIDHKPACYYRIHENNIHKNSIRQLNSVVQVLNRFFSDKPYPKIIDKWYYSALRHSDFKSAKKLWNERNVSRYKWRFKTLRLLFKKYIEG